MHKVLPNSTPTWALLITVIVLVIGCTVQPADQNSPLDEILQSGTDTNLDVGEAVEATLSALAAEVEANKSGEAAIEQTVAAAVEATTAAAALAARRTARRQTGPVDGIGQQAGQKIEDLSTCRGTGSVVGDDEKIGDLLPRNRHDLVVGLEDLQVGLRRQEVIEDRRAFSTFSAHI